jgi:adenylate cyclase
MKSRTTYLVLLLALLVSAFGLRVLDPLPIARLRLLVFDAYQWLAPRTYDPALQVRIIDIDDAAIRAVGQWPWPRSTMARMTERLTELGAAAIAFDIVMAEPDRSSPAQILGQLPKGILDEPGVRAVAERLSTLPNSDDAFARAIAAGPVILGFIGSDEEESSKMVRRAGAGFATTGDDPKLFVPRFSGALTSLDALQAASKGSGHLNWTPEGDQIVRRLPLLVSVGKELYPSLAAEALRVGQDVGSYIVKASGASGEEAFGRKSGLISVRIGHLAVPTDFAGQMWLRFSRTDRRRFISAQRLLAGEVEKSEIEGRVILIGTSAAGLFDLRATPLDAAVAGVEIHAQAIEQLLLEQHLERPDFANGAELVFLVVTGLMMGAFVYFAGAAMSAFLGAVTVVVALASSWLAFRNVGWLFDPVYPLITLTLIYLTTTAVLYWRTEKERNRVRHAFKQYLAPAMVEELARNPGKLKLGGELRPVTLMFCDVRGFTAISERLDAEQLTQFLNRLLTPLTNAILGNRGTVDKYMGDAIMAFWNAPLDDHEHERNAALASLDMLARLDDLNRQWAAEAAARGQTHVPVRLGIGLNTAECCVGNLGSDLRFDYSVIGDGVNVASRLEGQSKVYGLQNLVGESTAAQAGDLAILEVDLVSVVGRQEATRVYTLMGDGATRASPAFQALKARHEAMLAAYRGRRFAEAEVLLREARGLPGAEPLAKVYALYGERIAAFKLAPPPADWTGITVAAEK